uniref:Uncharacterized protein n=1 Tax=Ditylenchus dipsaci TaxID=166011 RepID=A0A915CRX7_9BILA
MNCVMKDCSTLRKQLLIPAFLRTAEKMMSNSSKDPDRQEPAICPNISPEVFKEAHQLEQEKRPFFRYPQNNHFVMPSSSARDKNTADLYENFYRAAGLSCN